MFKKIQAGVSVFTTASFLFASALVAGEYEVSDYTGVPIENAAVKRSTQAKPASAEFASLEIAGPPACQTVAHELDYDGSQRVRCSVQASPDTAEWSYLY
jgi:hypothetical protein